MAGLALLRQCSKFGHTEILQSFEKAKLWRWHALCVCRLDAAATGAARVEA
jgi:hypothetical protein